MPQKTVSELTKRDAILAAALPLFLANGYEKTSIRMIAGGAHCEVGLVYYYFETKEEIFECAIDLYFEAQRKALADLDARTEKDASLFPDEFFSYLEKESPAIADTFREKLHWTVSCAVRTKFAELCEVYIRHAVEALPSLPLSSELTAKAIADTAVTAALAGDLREKKEELRRFTELLTASDKSTGKRKDIPSFLL